MIVKKISSAGKLLDLNETRKIKFHNIILEPGQEVGIHTTKNREEVIVVLKGVATIELEGEDDINVEKDYLIYIPSGKKHNVKNTGNQTLHYFVFVCFD
ncbi:MAG: hypothetical protein COT91_00055 [Candidatus Doudnabacteria bacterium CG10_big_fil_rev_8_21_14_0_10_41_10]|uniref:Cupin type-2 domain-containing protein n=1 Tax=Candidatus Doudnabacteria bacterium CG10_big_fil_rev_8_21_14_0_10_41_10 TaxID=1974551 RepID=A0A2H0VF14_9BACT|nr:MAG: hypothetical protein COT91_00055 [Candidatus Doudnabacteria bacterium CG10_big_fil_rev_8_21_14_0_10_41_10]